MDQKTIKFVYIALIIVFGLGLYANSLNGRFILDDQALIKDNAYIKRFSYIPQVFRENLGQAAGIKSRAYRPMQMLSYMLDYSLYRLDVRGYHLSNVIIHILAAVSLFWLLALLTKNQLLAFGVSILFVVHPIHNSVVAYISGRADGLAVLFIFLTFITYLKLDQQKAKAGYIIMLLSYILALLSKENSLVFPLLLLVYHYTFQEKLKLSRFCPLLLIAVAYILLRLTFAQDLLSFSSGTSTLVQRIPGFFVAVTSYLKLLFLPLNLHLEYGDKLFKLFQPQAILGLSLLILLLGYAAKIRKQNKLISFAIFWFFIALLPCANLYYINAYMAENWLYLPAIGFFLILARVCALYGQTSLFRVPAIILAAGAVVFYSVLTVQQNSYWSDPEVFYQRTIKYAPSSPRAYNGLGLIKRAQGKGKQALALFKTAIKVDPTDPNGYNNLGLTYRDVGRTDKAIELYRQAIQLDPNYLKTYNNLALIYHSQGEHQQAIELYQQAIELNPNYDKVFYNLANIYYDLGKIEKAADLYQQAIQINPDYAQAYYNLGLSLRALGRPEDAIQLYQQAIRLKPDYAQAYINLAIEYQALGKGDQAMALLEKATQLKPNFAALYYNLGNTYRGLGKNKQAQAAYRQAIELKPDFAAAYYNLGNTYKDLGLAEQAQDAYKKARQLDPEKEILP
ncbi:tetratricopeptide repeat protein [Candidatus Omnitrophota bacterium]